LGDGAAPTWILFIGISKIGRLKYDLAGSFS
jgi:hypothetical protein